ncbi:hypothetical protein QOZ80_1BG0080630 [Eleusine coracana subsp. coracana]|nr:hypothetical protein QOZ80_1BG0080630 [Eleusine coracana subsp. coracana]
MARVTVAMVAVVALVVVSALVVPPRAEAGQNCICECMKLCVRANIPSMKQCVGKCRQRACDRSCEQACTRKGFPKLPAEGIILCELELLTPNEEHMLPH